MKTITQISLICIGLIAVSAFMVTVYIYPDSFGVTKPYTLVREGDYSKEGKDAYDYFRNHVSSTCPYTPKPASANSYDPVDCIWINDQCPFEGNPKYKRLFDSEGKIYVGMIDEFGSLITCDGIIIRMPETGSYELEEALSTGPRETKNNENKSDHTLEQVIEDCKRKDGFAYGMEWWNSTHFMDNNDCELVLMDKNEN